MELQCCIFGWALSLGVFCLLISSGAVQAKISDQNSRLRIAELEAELQSTKEELEALKEILMEVMPLIEWELTAPIENYRYVGARGKKFSYSPARGKRFNYSPARGKRFNYSPARGKRLAYLV